MPRSRLIAVVVVAALALLWTATALSQDLLYTCAIPKTGSAPVLYRWYVCWPDSNTLTFLKASGWPIIALKPANAGQRLRVQAVDSKGRTSPLSVASAPWPLRSIVGVGDTPDQGGPRLLPNYPNPFNPRTTIAFSLPQQARVRLDIYDAAGRTVRTLVDAELPGGVNRIAWDGTDAAGRAVASGTYLCRMVSGNATQMSRLMLVR